MSWIVLTSNPVSGQDAVNQNEAEFNQVLNSALEPTTNGAWMRLGQHMWCAAWAHGLREGFGRSWRALGEISDGSPL